MKIVLTGCTGFVGNEMLEQCIAHHFITHIYALTRKPLDKKYSSHRKVTEVQHDDFDTLPAHLFERMRDWNVQGCIWALGSRSQAATSADELHKVGIKYPLLAAEGIAGIAPEIMESQTGRDIKPFRFVFVSGWGAEVNQFRQLWVWSAWRKMKGAAEKGLFDIADSSKEVDGRRSLEVVALRPGSVLAKGYALGSVIAMGTTPSVTVDRVAHAAVRIVLDGDWEGRKILENKDLLGDDWARINTLRI